MVIIVCGSFYCVDLDRQKCVNHDDDECYKLFFKGQLSKYCGIVDIRKLLKVTESAKSWPPQPDLFVM